MAPAAGFANHLGQFSPGALGGVIERTQNGNGGWNEPPAAPKERAMRQHRKLLPWIVVIVTLKVKVTIARR